MVDRSYTYTERELTKVHDAAMDLLAATGVAFNDDEALAAF